MIVTLTIGHTTHESRMNEIEMEKQVYSACVAKDNTPTECRVMVEGLP